MVLPSYFGPLLFSRQLRYVFAIVGGNSPTPGFGARLLVDSPDLCDRQQHVQNTRYETQLGQQSTQRRENFIRGSLFSLATLVIIIIDVWLVLSGQQPAIGLAILPFALTGWMYYAWIYPRESVWGFVYPDLASSQWAAKNLLLRGADTFDAFVGHLDPTFWADPDLVQQIAAIEKRNPGSVTIWSHRLEDMPKDSADMVREKVVGLLEENHIGAVLRPVVPPGDDIRHFQVSNGGILRLEPVHAPWFEREEQETVSNGFYLSDVWRHRIVKRALAELRKNYPQRA